MSDRARVVFDCNTLLQAMASPQGPAGRCVQMAFDGLVQLFISPVVLGELRDVASRPRVSAKLRLVPGRVHEFCEAIELAATVLVAVPAVFQYERDADDAHYVNLALAGRAKLIVTRDRDLLDLMDPMGPEALAFRAHFPSLRILTPPQFLQELKSAR